MSKSNFIRNHIINKIHNIYHTKRKILGNQKFLYFDRVYKHNKNYKINRIGNSLLYSEDEVWPLSWYNISSENLIQIYDDLSKNRFFTYLDEDGKFHKIRLKTKIIK